MSAPQQQPELPLVPELDSTLALLGRAEPRMGLEQRVLARLAAAPAPLPWYRLLAARRLPVGWMMTTAGLLVAGTVTYSAAHWRPAGTSAGPAPGIARPARPVNRQAVSPAASVGVPDHPLPAEAPQAQTSLHHRGMRRAYRAQHARTALPPGTAVPRQPHLLSTPQ